MFGVQTDWFPFCQFLLIFIALARVDIQHLTGLLIRQHFRLARDGVEVELKGICRLLGKVVLVLHHFCTHE